MDTWLGPNLDFVNATALAGNFLFLLEEPPYCICNHSLLYWGKFPFGACKYTGSIENADFELTML